MCFLKKILQIRIHLFHLLQLANMTPESLKSVVLAPFIILKHFHLQFAKYITFIENIIILV